MEMTKAKAKRKETFQQIIGVYMVYSKSYKTLESIAKALGMSKASFSQRWNFQVEFRLDEVAAICRLLRVSDEDKAKLIA